MQSLEKAKVEHLLKLSFFPRVIKHIFW